MPLTFEFNEQTYKSSVQIRISGKSALLIISAIDVRRKATVYLNGFRTDIVIPVERRRIDFEDEFGGHVPSVSDHKDEFSDQE